MDFLTELKKACENKELPEKTYVIFRGLYESFQEAFKKAEIDFTPHEEIFRTFLEMVRLQCRTPFHFEPYHQKVTSPIDYYRFGIDFFDPLVDRAHSSVQKLENIRKIEAQLKAKENVILLANHQTEADPQLISIALEKINPTLAADMIFVAGDRVTSDPIAVPFSIGRNLLCIYAKRHVACPPERKAEKLEHNQRSMRSLKAQFSIGGKCVYVAPSGGRDRPDSEGKVVVSPLDPNSIEIFRLITKQSKRPAHFYPLALGTYNLLPPPKTIELEVGEWRNVAYAPFHFAFGDEIDMDNYPGQDIKERPARRAALADHIWKLIKAQYASF